MSPGPPLAECDLVMKGGVTSGVVYPGAIVELARRYRFRSIGGTSAGAIGAGVAAAAEYRRQDGRGDSVAESLSGLVDDLVAPGALAALLQPTRPTRPLMGILLAAMRQGRHPARRALAVLGRLLAARWWLTAIVTVAAAIVVREILRAAIGGLLAGVLVLIVVLFAALVAVGGCALLLGLAVRRALDDPDNGFGMCSGRREGDAATPALTEWLHSTIQQVAGLPDDEPLTFAQLREKEINLALITTDLSNGRPLRLPLEREGGLRFDLGELGRLFPKPIAEHLDAVARPPTRRGCVRCPPTSSRSPSRSG